MVYDLRENIKNQLDSIADVSFLAASKRTPIQLWEALTNEYAAINVKR
jgi:hypothetical protein